MTEVPSGLGLGEAPAPLASELTEAGAAVRVARASQVVNGRRYSRSDAGSTAVKVITLKARRVTGKL